MKKNDYNDTNAESVITLHNVTSCIYLVSIIIVLQGFYQYYNRQRREHRKHWSTMKFIFGTKGSGIISSLHC